MRRALLTLIVLAAAACESPTIPPKIPNELWDFRLPTDPPRVIRWPSGARISVWVQAAEGAREDVLTNAFTAGASAWNRQALFGEYALERATSIQQADVLLRWSDEPAPVDMSECEPQISIAVTTFCLAESDSTRLHVYPFLPPNENAASSVRMVVTILGTLSTSADVNALVAHELGHALGLARHSPNAQDLMFPGPERATPGPRDIAAVRTLYHTEAEITP